MERMVKIVAPLGVQFEAARFARGEETRVIEITLGDERQVASGGGGQFLDFALQLFEKRLGGRVHNRVHGVEAKAVELKIAQTTSRRCRKKSGALRRCPAPSKLRAEPHGVE